MFLPNASSGDCSTAALLRVANGSPGPQRHDMPSMWQEAEKETVKVSQLFSLQGCESAYTFDNEALMHVRLRTGFPTYSAKKCNLFCSVSNS